MPKETELRIGGKSYRLAVDDGQEQRLRQVAAYFDGFVTRLAQTGTMDRDRLLVLASLMMADEALTARQAAESELQTLHAFQASLADRIERMADSLGA